MKNQLCKRETEGNLRRLHISEKLIDFSSNDYLGLARSSVLSHLVDEELRHHRLSCTGLGSTGSRLLTGNSHYAEDLENKIACFHGFEAGLLFNCGYMANLGLLSCIAGKEDYIFYDSKIHASMHAGIRLSEASSLPFRHNNLIHLENRLKNCTARGSRFICIESIYSTDGSTAPLKELCCIAKKYEAQLIVDEAHAVGVRGETGRGLVAEYNLCPNILAQITTFGKALGAQGAIVLGNQILKDFLINFASSYIYTTALPLYSLAVISCGYDLFPKMGKERNQLQSLIQLYRKFIPSASQTHIQSIPVSGNATIKELSQKIAKEGFDVRPLISPTVQKGKEILRICLHAFNTIDELAFLLNFINTYREGK